MARETLTGKLSAFWIPAANTPADLAALTVADLTAVTTSNLLGTKTGEALYVLGGLEPSDSTVNTEDYISAEAGALSGVVTFATLTLGYYWDPAAHPIWDLWAPDDDGVLVLSQAQAVVGSPYKARVVTVSRRDHDFGAPNVASTWTAAFSQSAPITGELA